MTASVDLVSKGVKWNSWECGRTGGNSLAGEDFNGEPSLIEVLDVDGATSQGGDQLNLGVVEEVVLPTGEPGVWLLLNLEDDITGDYAWCLVSLAAELNLGAALNTTVDMDVEDLAIHDGLLARAPLAAILVLEDFALAIAIGANGLETLDHGSHLAHHGLDALAVAATTLLDRALLAATTLALGADDGSLERQLRDLAPVDVLEGDVVSVEDGLGLLRAALWHTAATAEHATEAAAATEELGKQVLGSHAATTPGAAFEAGLAILVVYLALVGIRKDLIGV